VAENLNVPRPERDPPHKLPEPVASNSTTKQLHDLPGDPTYHSPQPLADQTPNSANDPPRELPSGVLWC
jgi:hypothetical protein